VFSDDRDIAADPPGGGRTSPHAQFFPPNPNALSNACLPSVIVLTHML